jgi:hypothetical protein
MPKDDLSALFAQDAGEVNAPTQEALSKIAELARQQMDLEKAVEEAELVLKEKKAALAKVQTEELPDAMDEVGMSEFKLTDGTKVTIKRGFAPNLTKANQSTAYRWLRENGHGAIIKHEFTSKFGKDEEKLAARFSVLVREAGFTYSEKESIAPQTLKAFVNEQMTQAQESEDAVAFPQELFGVFPYRIASVS